MDNETKIALLTIEKHLKALVHFKTLQMTREMALAGSFTEDGVFNQDKANAKMKDFLESAYNKDGLITVKIKL